MAEDGRIRQAQRYPCRICPLRGRHAFRDFSKAELDYIQQFKRGELVAAAGTTIAAEGTRTAHFYTVLSGWGMRHKALADGRRQIVGFLLPGDLIGLQTSIFGDIEHSVEALTPLMLCVFERARLWNLFETHPSLAYDLTWIAARDERLLDEALLSVGRRSALERAAQLILSLYRRADRAGLVDNGRLEFPLTQQVMGDALGISLVHTNKTLKRLSQLQAVGRDGRWLVVRDEDRLAGIAMAGPRSTAPRPFL